MHSMLEITKLSKTFLLFYLLHNNIYKLRKCVNTSIDCMFGLENKIKWVKGWGEKCDDVMTQVTYIAVLLQWN